VAAAVVVEAAVAGAARVVLAVLALVEPEPVLRPRAAAVRWDPPTPVLRERAAPL
jgi:hypothetical protein